MNRRARLTPDAQTGGDVCRQLLIPPELLPFVNEALDQLAEPDGWEEHGDMTVEQTVDLVNTMLFDNYGACEVSNPITRLMVFVNSTANTTEQFFDSYPSDEITIPADFGSDGDAVAIRSQWVFTRPSGESASAFTLRSWMDGNVMSQITVPALGVASECVVEFDTYCKFLESTGFPLVHTRAIIRTYSIASLPFIATPTITTFPVYKGTPFANPDWSIDHYLHHSCDATVTESGHPVRREWGVTEHWRF